MKWADDLLALADWALQLQDLRHRYLHASTAEELTITPGIACCIETVAVLGIYESAIGKGYRRWETIDYERSYPKESEKNPRRADLAFKEPGSGKNWAYIEVKNYKGNGKVLIESDIKKLKSIEHRSQRWMLIYRIRPETGRHQALDKLLVKNFSNQIVIYGLKEFQTITEDKEDGICEICLIKIT
ncbi:hypothetical protein [Methylomonas rivi]|uniref:Protein NO VEIN C-terminal domain-containing protein n=1 Tax=Methylomonas rivi TaxID=2952226 RepID=A0ABT1UBB0_9GAMM|nr:hypothetical protein [Methylomonas sp. WSC-6]MCQ8130371.1 hypothetical protein [Methylomonas sp. WSC-6]